MLDLHLVLHNFKNRFRHKFSLLILIFYFTLPSNKEENREDKKHSANTALMSCHHCSHHEAAVQGC